jgi:dethiobiotin synthetase
VIRFHEALSRIQRVAERCEWLVVEGAGGLMAPLGEKFCAAELIAHLQCAVVVVAANKLGTLNHTLLTVGVPQLRKARETTVVLNESRPGDCTATSNATVLRELLPRRVSLVELPFLGENAGTVAAVRHQEKIFKKVLAQISGSAIFTPVLSKRGSKKTVNKNSKKAIDGLRRVN